MSQSALSASVRALERELDSRLFVRTTRKVELTEAGRVLLEGARRTLAAAASARESVLAVRGLLRGSLRVGGIPTPGLLDQAALLARFRDQHPAVGIRYARETSMALIPQIEARPARRRARVPPAAAARTRARHPPQHPANDVPLPARPPAGRPHTGGYRVPGGTGLHRATPGLDRLRGRQPGPRPRRQATTGHLRGRQRPHHPGLRRPRAGVHPPPPIPGHQPARPSSHPARRPGHHMDPRRHHQPPPGHTSGARLRRPPPTARTAPANAPRPAVTGPAWAVTAQDHRGGPQTHNAQLRATSSTQPEDPRAPAATDSAAPTRTDPAGHPGSARGPQSRSHCVAVAYLYP